jgi:hypothetical protein
MALLRVIGVALVASSAIALAACNAAGADPNAAASPRAARPEGWKQLPAMASAVGAAAKADGVTIDSVDAWGEPANGCYAVWLALHGASGDAPTLADQVLAGISRAGGPRGGVPQARSKETGSAAPAVQSKETAPPAPAVQSKETGPAAPAARSRERAPTALAAQSKDTGPAALAAQSKDTGAAAPAARSKESAVSGELVISELVKPTGREGVLAFAFANAPFRGRVRARLGGGRIAAVACFGNERAPLVCDATCGRVLEGSP